MIREVCRCHWTCIHSLHNSAPEFNNLAVAAGNIWHNHAVVAVVRKLRSILGLHIRWNDKWVDSSWYYYLSCLAALAKYQLVRSVAVALALVCTQMVIYAPESQSNMTEYAACSGLLQYKWHRFHLVRTCH